MHSTQCIFIDSAYFFTSRATVLYAALVAPYDNVHIRHTIPLLEDGLKYGHSSGDRYAMMFVDYYRCSFMLVFSVLLRVI